jgi:hypothetical protein
MTLKNHIIVFLLLTGQLLLAQVTFEAKVSKKKLGVNERIKIDFIMNQDGDNFTPPSFAGFNIVSGPSQSINRSWVNGKSSFSKTYTYTLAPTRKGIITIKNASIEVDGERYKTIPIKVTVGNAVEKPQSNAEYLATENIHLVAEVSKAKPYFNEAITVTYKLYFKDLDISGLRDVNLPKYKDFWSKEIELKDQRAKQGTYNDQNYDYVVLKKTVLYPQKTGKLTIDPMSAEIISNVPTSKFNFFGRVYQKANIPVTSAKRIIDVKALPENGKPEGFTGAVGSFSFDVITNKKSLRAGESLEARIEISGSGNLKLLDLPKLTTPSALEVYEPVRKDNVRINASGMFGKVSDSYTIVPAYKGKYPIPVIEFSYFDLETETYKIRRSIEHVIDVIDGPTNTAITSEQTTNSSGVSKQKVRGKNQFNYISSKPNLSAINKASFFKSTRFWLFLLLPLLAIPIAMIIGKKKRQLANDVQGNRIKKADKLAKKFLSEAKSNLNNKTAFYESLHKSLHNYLKAKLAIETSEFSKEKINSLLEKRAIPEQLSKDFIALIESCELARFTPITAVTMQEDYQQSVRVITAIDKQIS